MTAASSAAAEESDAVAAAVLGCPAVASLHSGGFRGIATLLPGRRVEGVRLGDDRVEIGVVAAHGPPIIAVVDQIRAAVAPLVGGRRIDVHVHDLQLPEDEQPALPAGSG